MIFSVCLSRALSTGGPLQWSRVMTWRRFAAVLVRLWLPASGCGDGGTQEEQTWRRMCPCIFHQSTAPSTDPVRRTERRSSSKCNVLIRHFTFGAPSVFGPASHVNPLARARDREQVMPDWFNGRHFFHRNENSQHNNHISKASL